MRPFDRDLDRAQLEFVGQEQKLGIETPALDPLPGENGLCRRPGERLEAALRVAILQSKVMQREVE